MRFVRAHRTFGAGRCRKSGVTFPTWKNTERLLYCRLLHKIIIAKE